jgi:hypothetical protein
VLIPAHLAAHSERNADGQKPPAIPYRKVLISSVLIPFEGQIEKAAFILEGGPTSSGLRKPSGGGEGARWRREREGILRRIGQYVRRWNRWLLSGVALYV